MGVKKNYLRERLADALEAVGAAPEREKEWVTLQLMLRGDEDDE